MPPFCFHCPEASLVETSFTPQPLKNLTNNKVPFIFTEVHLAFPKLQQALTIPVFPLPQLLLDRHSSYQESFVKFKQTGELFEQLMDSIQPLKKHWALLILIFHLLLVATAITKFVTKIQPVWFNQHLETLSTMKKFNCRVGWLQHWAAWGSSNNTGSFWRAREDTVFVLNSGAK